MFTCHTPFPTLTAATWDGPQPSLVWTERAADWSPFCPCPESASISAQSVLSSLVSRSKSLLCPLLHDPPHRKSVVFQWYMRPSGTRQHAPPPPHPLSDIIPYPSLFFRSLWPAGLLATLPPQGLCSRVPISEMSLPTHHLPS